MQKKSIYFQRKMIFFLMFPLKIAQKLCNLNSTTIISQLDSDIRTEEQKVLRWFA